MVFLGALKKIEILPAADFAPTLPCEKVQKNAMGAFDWQNVDFVAKSAGMKIDSKSTDAGVIYPATVDCNIAGVDSLELYKTGELFVLILHDFDNNTFFIGRKTTPLILTTKTTIPKTPTQRPGVNLEFKGDLLKPFDIL